MNQQMNLLVARAVARDREHQLRPHPRVPRRRFAAGRLALPSLGRRDARPAGSRPTHALAARG